jgi:hypothetical protein
MAAKRIGPDARDPIINDYLLSTAVLKTADNPDDLFMNTVLDKKRVTA